MDAAPDWVLAEHGGPFEYNAEDFKRRVQWGKESAKAADAICASGNHRVDWDPHHVHVEPLLQKAKPGETLNATLVVSNHLARKTKWLVTLEGRGLMIDQKWDVDVDGGETVRRRVVLRLDQKMQIGRHIFALRVEQPPVVDCGDAFLAIEVEK